MRLSIVIPTLNSEKTLRECLEAILDQSMARESYEIVVADAGSSDATLEIARSCGVDVVVENELKTGEAGKAAGIKASQGELVALIDSDNIMADPAWLERLTAPFEDEEIMGSEPLSYDAREGDPALSRYFAWLGMTDPLCLFVGNYDRMCAITGKWSGLPVAWEDRGEYLKLNLSEETLPTIGANGFVFRRRLLEGVEWYPYFFDIDVMQQAIRMGHTHIAKVKVGIVHLYCERLRDFARKQQRRIRDFLYYTQERQRTYPWGNHKRGVVLFVVATLLGWPLLIQMVMGAARKPDRAWWYHPVACWLTLWIYGWATIGKVLGLKQAPVRRDRWQLE